MSVLVSVLTPDWLVHVSDAGPTLRTAAWRAGPRRGLLTWVGDGDPAWMVEAAAGRAEADPEALATHLARLAAAAHPAARAAIWLGGFGFSPEGHEAGFRWEASALHEPGDFAVEGAWVVPTPVRAGKGAERARGRAQSAFQIHVATDLETLPLDVRRGVDDLPKHVKAGASATALAAAALVRKAVPGADALVVHLPRSGAPEGAVIGATMRAVPVPTADGVASVG